MSISDVGLLSFKSTADYEVKALYSLILKVSDGITEVEQDITVTLVDVEEEDQLARSNNVGGMNKVANLNKQHFMGRSTLK